MCLKNEALLDNFVGFKPEGNTYAAFIYVAKYPDNVEAWQAIFEPLGGCLKPLDIFIAFVRREGVNILQLVEEMRRVPLPETNQRLQEVADAMMILARDLDDTPPEEETVPLTQSMLPSVGAPAEAVRACAGCGSREPASGEPLRMCSGCSHVFYCNAACQRSHWGAHKAACRLKAAAGGKN